MIIYRKLRMSNDVILRSVGHLQPDPLWRLKAQKHPIHELIVVLHGRMQVSSATGDILQANTGDVLLYPMGIFHTEQSDPHDPVESLFFPFVAPRQYGNRILMMHDHDGRMRQIARWLHADHTARDATTRDAFQLLFRALLAEFTRPNRRPDPPIAVALRQYVRSRLDAQIYVAALAAQAGLSRYHYIRLYRKQTGHTPMAEVRRLRFECARDLLLTTTLPIKEIARRSGLGSAQTFSRAFSAHQGQAPAAFRNSFSA